MIVYIYIFRNIIFFFPEIQIIYLYTYLEDKVERFQHIGGLNQINEIN